MSKPKYSDDPYEQGKADHIFDPLNSMEEMNDWFYTYFGLRFPSGTIYPGSTHGPADAIWRIYELMKTGQSSTIPEIVLYSSRDSGKTVAASAAMILCLIHFRFSVALASATLDQTQKPIQYNNQFFSKISPYLKYHGWKQIGDSKSKIEWVLPDGEQIYVRVLPMTKKGMNCIDENSIVYCENKGKIKASEVKIGDRILTRNYLTGKDLYVTVKDIGYTEKFANVIETSNGSRLVCSTDHQVFTERGWIPSDQCKIGTKLLTQGDPIKTETNSESIVTHEEDPIDPLKRDPRTPIKHRNFGRYLDTGKVFEHKKHKGAGFRFEGKRTGVNRKIASFVRSQLNDSVVKIDRIGKIKLIDLVIDTENEHLKSFYANTILIHNSEHLPMLFCDEIDLVQDSQALDEAKMVPTSYKGFSPLMISLSTMKYAGGNMEKKVKSALEAGGEILKWNIIDVTQPISKDEAQADRPKVTRYLRELPFGNLSEEEWRKLSEKEQLEYEKTEVYAGIVKHPLLPVMKNLLVGREVNNSPIYKTHQAVLNNFRQVSSTSMEMAAAQLLCKKPSSAGLVYPRFDILQNVLSPSAAYKRISGEENQNCDIEELCEYLKAQGVTFVGGMDFGFTDYTSAVVFAILPNGEIWLIDAALQNKVEVDDVVKIGVELTNKWGIDRWYVDQASPMVIKTLRRAGLTVPEFKKVVWDGIAAVQFKICDSQGTRKFFIVSQPNTGHIPDCFGSYSWKKDRKGDPIEGVPHHDDEYISDVMDSIRYPIQVLFSKTGKKPMIGGFNPAKAPPTALDFIKKLESDKPTVPPIGSDEEKEVFGRQVADRVFKETGISVGQTKELGAGTVKRKKIFWSK